MSEGFVRMTISISAVVRKSMDRCPKSVNWSAIAAEAFSAEADRHQPKSKRKLKMTKANAARLKKSLEKFQGREYREGQHDGFDWASEYADAGELKRLKRYRVSQIDGVHDYWDEHFREDTSIQWDAPFDSLGHIARSVLSQSPDDDDIDQGYIDDFYEHALGYSWESLLEDLDYMHGFFDGALEAWEQALANM